MTDEESGKAFEAEFSHHVGFFDRDARDHDYLFSEVKFAWHGWQAAIRWMQSQQEWRPMDSALRDGTFLILGGARPGSGPKPIHDAPMTRRNVMLDDETVEKARRIGEGNVSEGIRMAVKKMKDK